eukprot:m.351678 g.351678  ORF g.351678 m.351678 type:complete len:351 (+) comp16309_c0_seq1:414-1466(+)
MAAQQTICITGATGYIASHIVKQLLEDGNVKLHLTVRDPTNEKKVGFLKKIVADANAEDRVKLFAADLLKEGSFAEALEGCDAVMHTASPFLLENPRDPQRQLIEPAVHGTENVLMSAAKVPTITRIVLTSSCVAMYGSANDKEGKITEEDWNTSSTLATNAYSLSKTQAEKRAWELAEAQDQYKLVVINPALVLGPTLSGRNDTSSIQFLNMIVGGKMSSGCPDLTFGAVDVRDVAAAHIAAWKSESASGRHILCARSCTFLEAGQIVHAKYPGYATPSRTVPKFLLYLTAPFIGVTWHFIRNSVGIPLEFDNTKSQEQLGIKYSPIDKSIFDMLDSMVEAGLVADKRT